MVTKRALVVVLAALVLAACTGGGPNEKFDGYPGRDWTKERAPRAGFKPNAVSAMDRRLAAAQSSCFVITRNGKLVHEEDFGSDKNTAVPAWSATKSFTSVLVGIAVDEGKLELDDKASQYIPQWKGTPSENVTIRDLLSNTSGRHWDLATDYQKMAFGAADKTQFAIGLGQDAPPGTRWRYNNSAIQTLEPILKKATGEEPADYAQEKIFDPLQMNNTTWGSDQSGHSTTFSGVNSTCLDMARFGYLMMKHGKWRGRQIVSSGYVDEATGKASSDLNAAYGLLWWVNDKGPVLGSGIAMGGGEGAAGDQKNSRLAPDAPADAFWALGAGRQIISVIPSKGIVAVRMGPAPGTRAKNITPNFFTGDLVDALR